jgi:hypothetical protein
MEMRRGRMEMMRRKRKEKMRREGNDENERGDEGKKGIGKGGFYSVYVCASV